MYTHTHVGGITSLYSCRASSVPHLCLSVCLTFSASLLLSLIYISPLMVTMVTVKLVYSRSCWRLHWLLSVSLGYSYTLNKRCWLPLTWGKKPAQESFVWICLILCDIFHLAQNICGTISDCICVFKGNGCKPTAVKHYDTFSQRLSDVCAQCLKDRLCPDISLLHPDMCVSASKADVRNLNAAS